MSKGFAIGWRQVGACLILLATSSMIASAFSVVAVPLAAEFRPSRMVLMLAMTLLSAVSGLLSPFMGQLMDRWSLRALMGLGAMLLVSGFATLSFAASFAQVLLIYALFMAPANILIGPMAATVLLSRWFSRRRGTALGIAISGVALGGFVFPPLIQTLLDASDWRTALRLFSLILLALTVPAVALVVNSPAERGLHPDGTAADPTASIPGDPPQSFSARALLSDPAFWMLAAVFAVVLAGMKGMVTNLVPLATDQGISASAAALLISIFAAGGFAAKLSFAAIADRINPRILLALSLAGFALGMACLTQAEAGYWIIAAAVALIGFFGGFLVPLQGLLIPRIWGQGVVGRVSGLFNLVVLCALLVTPPIVGAVFDHAGQYDLAFIVFGVLAVACLLLLRYTRLEPQAAAAGITERRGSVPIEAHG